MSDYERRIVKPAASPASSQVNRSAKGNDTDLPQSGRLPEAPKALANPLTLPIDSQERKNYPMLSGCLKYFPAALAGIAKVSKLGNDKHNPGQPMHHARGKSADHGDCIIRHLTDTEDLLAAFNRNNPDVTPEQVLLEASQLAWRALAYSQELHEKFGAPLAPGAGYEHNPK